MAPFVKIRGLPSFLPVHGSSLRETTSRAMGSPSSNSPGREWIIGQHTSTIGLMSGSPPTLLRGQCTPIMLIVFLDDFTDGLASGYHGSSHVEDVDEATALGNCQGDSGL